MNFKNIFIPFFSSSILIGCTALPENLSNDELANISSVEQLIDDVIGFREANIEYRSYLTFPSDKDILKPALYLKNYCSYLNGEINQEKLKMPKLIQTNTQFGTDGMGYVFDKITASFGRFTCKNEENEFIVDITHGRSSYVDASARKTKVVIKPITKEQLKSEIMKKKLIHEENLKKAEARKTKLKIKLNTAKELFQNGQKTDLTEGQKICSRDNKMGYVEKISNDKIKILLLARVRGAADYALFYQRKPTLISTKQSYRWEDKSKWSKCEFYER